MINSLYEVQKSRDTEKLLGRVFIYPAETEVSLVCTSEVVRDREPPDAATWKPSA